MIVIASDHHVHTTDFGGGIPKDIPFFIINCDIQDKMYKGPCNQVDLYTTLIDLLNIPNAWPGLGYSLADNRYNSLELKERWDVSELILFSDYFKGDDSFM
jgi:lipoteichoic acid synthase